MKPIDLESLRQGRGAPLFEGDDHGGAAVSFFVAQPPPGRGPDLHRHPYQEVFLVEVGTARFTVGDEEIEVHGGQVVIGPAGVPHRFENAGSGRLRLVTMHPVGRVETEWLAGEH